MSQELKTGRDILLAQAHGKTVQTRYVYDNGVIWKNLTKTYSCYIKNLDNPIEGYRIKPKERYR